jgi:hypothetical protein
LIILIILGKEYKLWSSSCIFLQPPVTSSLWGRPMPWWQGTHPTWVDLVEVEIKKQCERWYAIAGDALTYELVQYGSCSWWTTAWRWPCKAETCCN